ncbi:hypothetical protein HK405_013603, partial [Cladochytrium tenue]
WLAPAFFVFEEEMIRIKRAMAQQKLAKPSASPITAPSPVPTRASGDVTPAPGAMDVDVPATPEFVDAEMESADQLPSAESKVEASNLVDTALVVNDGVEPSEASEELVVVEDSELDPVDEPEVVQTEPNAEIFVEQVADLAPTTAEDPAIVITPTPAAEMPSQTEEQSYPPDMNEQVVPKSPTPQLTGRTLSESNDIEVPHVTPSSSPNPAEKISLGMETLERLPPINTDALSISDVFLSPNNASLATAVDGEATHKDTKSASDINESPLKSPGFSETGMIINAGKPKDDEVPATPIVTVSADERTISSSSNLADSAVALERAYSLPKGRSSGSSVESAHMDMRRSTSVSVRTSDVGRLGRRSTNATETSEKGITLSRFRSRSRRSGRRSPSASAQRRTSKSPSARLSFAAFASRRRSEAEEAMTERYASLADLPPDLERHLRQMAGPIDRRALSYREPNALLTDLEAFFKKEGFDVVAGGAGSGHMFLRLVKRSRAGTWGRAASRGRGAARAQKATAAGTVTATAASVVQAAPAAPSAAAAEVRPAQPDPTRPSGEFGSSARRFLDNGGFRPGPGSGTGGGTVPSQAPKPASRLAQMVMASLPVSFVRRFRRGHGSAAAAGPSQDGGAVSPVPSPAAVADAAAA